MPQGDKSAYTDKQKRKAEHIEESYEKRGASKDEAERRAWATVNKESGGGNKSGGTWQAGHQGFFTRRQEKRRRGFRGPKRRRPVGGGQERLGNATQRWQALSWRVLKNSVTPKPGLRRRGGGGRNPHSRNQANTDHPVFSTSFSSATAPARLVPAALRPGDQTQIAPCPGASATMPPPTPLLPGRPTRNAKSPELS